jgi:HK97 family phage portal protein
VSLLDWFRPKNELTLTEPEIPGLTHGGVFGGTGITVTPDKAMRISAVYACVRILAETVASLPVHVYQRTSDGRERIEHPLNDLLGVSCNGEQTAMELREFQMTSLGLRGNAYARIQRSNRGGVGAIHALKPGYMRVQRDGSGRLVFVYNEPGNEGIYADSEIWRIAGLGGDGVTGYSPITLAAESMGVAIATEQSAARLFSNGQQGSLALEFDHALTPEQIEALRNQFAANQAGYQNAHKPLLLESGMKAKEIGMNANDAQFLESRKFQISEIARWYRVPLHMLNELDRATFSNIEHQSIEFVMHTIRPWLVRIEQTISRDLLTARERAAGVFVAHNVEGLLRGDSKSRYEAYASAITNGWMSRNEVRKLENLNPAEGLDEYLAPLNMAGAESDDAEAIENLARAENAVLAKEADEAADLDDFAKRLEGFYSRHEKRISLDLGVSADGYGMQRVQRMAGYKPREGVCVAQQFTNSDLGALL